MQSHCKDVVGAAVLYSRQFFQCIGVHREVSCGKVCFREPFGNLLEGFLIEWNYFLYAECFAWEIIYLFI